MASKYNDRDPKSSWTKNSWDFPCNFEDCLELRLTNWIHHICVPLGENQPQTLAETPAWSLLGGHRSQQSKQELGWAHLLWKTIRSILPPHLPSESWWGSCICRPPARAPRMSTMRNCCTVLLFGQPLTHSIHLFINICTKHLWSAHSVPDNEIDAGMKYSNT